MKSYSKILLIICIMFIFVGCSGAKAGNENLNTTVETSLIFKRYLPHQIKVIALVLKF